MRAEYDGNMKEVQKKLGRSDPAVKMLADSMERTIATLETKLDQNMDQKD